MTGFHLKTVLLVFTLLITCIANAQTGNRQIILHFNSNEWQLSAADQQQLDSAWKELIKDSIQRIHITGYTDATASHAYNFKLSEKRALAAKAYFLQHGVADSLITTAWKGEDQPLANNTTEDGKQANRRAEIRITYTLQKEPDQLVSTPQPDSCHLGDTTITLAGGTQLVFDLCEYHDIKDCIEFVEIVSTPQVVQSGLTLMDKEGYPIASCGMISINIKQGCANIPCFKYPVKVRFPRYPSSDCDRCNRNANVYGVKADGTWVVSNQGRSEISIIKIGAQEYFQFEISCPNALTNCDCRKGGDDIVFKVPKQYRIVKLNVAYECPVMVIDMYKTDKPNIVQAKLPCLTTPKTVMGTVLNESGDTLVLPPTPLNNLKKKARRNKCRAKGNKTAYYWLGIFPIAERIVYKQYIIEPTQLVKKK